MRITSLTSLPRSVSLSLSALLLSLPIVLVASAYSTSDLNAQHIAGIWRLKSKQSFLPRNPIAPTEYPLKEFTVIPLPKKRVVPSSSPTPPPQTASDGTVTNDSISNAAAPQEVFLLLREDGKYAQFHRPSESKKKLSLSKFKRTAAAEEDLGVMEGTWALVDGKLILAADRPKHTHNIRSDGRKHDTILVGRVICTSGETLTDNPALLKKTNSTSSSSTTTAERTSSTPSSPPSSSSSASTVTPQDPKSQGGRRTSTDVHLSVPKGKVKVGKFFYPQHHPSFFEQPIFEPMNTGSFELEQVLGTLNTQYKRHDEELVEKFKKQDLMDKRYYLTSFPIPNTRKKKQRWSIKYNKFVDDKPKSQAEKEREEREKNMPVPIRTFEVDLFANNTFQTVAGYGDDLILRGKWSIIGNDRDQLWMNVWRFGFGRSVSGSTFSEGRSLTQKDEVAYWGKIYEVDASNQEDSVDDDPTEWKGTRIEINGSVMQGVGLEPCSIARFTMIEKTEEDYDLDDDEDEDNDDNFPDASHDYGEFE